MSCICSSKSSASRLIEEFGIEAVDGWRGHLQTARERWRRSQVKAVIRDAPSDAVEALIELGYEITPPRVAPVDNHDAQRQY